MFVIYRSIRRGIHIPSLFLHGTFLQLDRYSLLKNPMQTLLCHQEDNHNPFYAAGIHIKISDMFLCPCQRNLAAMLLAVDNKLDMPHNTTLPADLILNPMSQFHQGCLSLFKIPTGQAPMNTSNQRPLMVRNVEDFLGRTVVVTMTMTMTVIVIVRVGMGRIVTVPVCVSMVVIATMSVSVSMGRIATVSVCMDMIRIVVAFFPHRPSPHSIIWSNTSLGIPSIVLIHAREV